MLPADVVIGILADNMRRRGSVLPVPRRHATRWARELGLPRGGETVLYTGQMPQLVPSVARLVALGETPLARLAALARPTNRVLNLTGLFARPSRAERAEFDRISTDVALLLRRAGIEFGSLYEDDLYAGALAWDLGLDELVAAQAQRIASLLERHGVRRLITIDPHTTTMLRSVFPELVPGFGVEVLSYLEALAAAPPLPGSGQAREVVLHDSCVFARTEGVVDEPRELLARAGVAVLEPPHAGRGTWCCGGPAESLHPEKAAAVAGARVAQLSAVGPAVTTMCPICLVNLRKAAPAEIRIEDLSHVLAEAVESR